MQKWFFLPKSKTILKRKFLKKYQNIYTRNRNFRTKQNKYLMYVLLFWVLMLFGLRMGSLFSHILTQWMIADYRGLKVELPDTKINHSSFYSYKNTLDIWVDRSNKICIEDTVINYREVEGYLLSLLHNFPKPKMVYFYGDKQAKASIVVRMVLLLNKNNINSYKFVSIPAGEY